MAVKGGSLAGAPLHPLAHAQGALAVVRSALGVAPGVHVKTDSQVDFKLGESALDVPAKSVPRTVLALVTALAIAPALVLIPPHVTPIMVGIAGVVVLPVTIEGGVTGRADRCAFTSRRAIFQPQATTHRASESGIFIS